MAQLTRDEMAAVIAGGGSVLYEGRTIWRAQDLPSEADLAQGDPEKEAAASASLQEQIAQLQADLAKLQQPPADAAPKSKKTAGDGAA
jgi:hypothetical protein